MRPMTTDDEQLWAAEGGRVAYFRVSVKDGSGNWRDLTTWPGENLVVGASWKEDVDGNGLTADITLRRSVERISLAPLHDTSPLNNAFLAPPGGVNYEPLLQAGRSVLIETALVPDGVTPTTWREAFRGQMDKWSHDTGNITLECRDQVARVMDCFIERERAYAYARGVFSVVGCFVFEPGRVYPSNVLVIPTEAKRNGHYYAIQTPGTAGSTEPTWPTGSSSTVTSGGVTFLEVGVTSTTLGRDVEDVMQQLLDDNLGVGTTMWVPSSPAWQILHYLQDRRSLWDALRMLVDQIGWDLRFKWNDGAGEFQLALTQPDRFKTTPDFTFGAYDTRNVKRLEQSIEGIRNVVAVTYSDSGALDSAGQPLRKQVMLDDSASITKYGRRYMEVQEASSSNIDTQAEAENMANAMLEDLKEPNAEMSVELGYFPWVELGDLHRYSPDGHHFTFDLDLAVVGYEHSFDERSSRTTVTLRGSPSGGYLRWLRHDGRVDQSDVHDLTLFDTGSGFLALANEQVGGAQLYIDTPEGKFTHGTEYEWHVSDDAGFTPDTSTLMAANRDRAASLAQLVPGKEYFAKVVPRAYNSRRLVRGLPSEAIAFTAGRARAGHYDALVSQAHFPLNGNFEHASDDLTVAPPDHWHLSSGSWGASDDLYYGLDGVFGRYISLRELGGNPLIVSSAFPIRRGVTRSNLYLSVRPHGTLGASSRLVVYVRFYSLSDLSDSPTVFTLYVPHDVTAPGSWAAYTFPASTFGTVPYTANFATIEFGKETLSAAYGWDIGDVYLEPAYQQDFHVARLNGEETEWLWDGLTYSNAWVDHGSTYAGGEFMRDPMGIAHLRGLVKKGSGTPSSGEIIAVLPDGCRPVKPLTLFVLTDGGEQCRLEIEPDGEIRWNMSNDTPSAGYGYLSLEGITFDTR